MKGQRVLVLGLGRSGLGATRLLRAKGAEVLVRDDADNPSLRERAEQARALGARVELGGRFDPLPPLDFCVISPGLDPRAPSVVELGRRRIPVISEVELGYRFLKSPLIAVTGTNGKTTTVSLIAHVLRECGTDAVAAGNLGYPLCDGILDHPLAAAVVLEVSSFQLEGIVRFRPQIAVLLNISPNHLDRYSRFEDYVAAKARIMANLRPCDTLIYKEECADFLAGDLEACPARRLCFTAGKPLNGHQFGLRDDGMIVGGIPPAESPREPLVPLGETRLRGRHNAENIMAAAAVALVWGLPRARIAAALRSFAPLPHRCETVATVGGVQFVNDSKATSPDAVEKALSAFDAPVVLIAGGRNKGLDLNKPNPVIGRRVKHLVLIGETTETLARSWGAQTPFTRATTMTEAVRAAFAAARPGEVVLLSPGCASFDMFQGYEHRGEVFKQAVRELQKEWTTN